MIPILCHTYVGQSTYCRPIRPAISWFEDNGKYVRRLLWALRDTPLPFLELCPNLEHLSLWVDVDIVNISSLLPVISNMSLRYLSVNITALTRGGPFSTSDASIRLFQSITHLDLIIPTREKRTWQEIEGISEMESLTHLSFDRQIEEKVILDVLKFCPKIQVLALCSASYDDYYDDLLESLKTGRSLPKRGGIAEPPHPESVFFDDERVVFYTCNWHVEYEVSARGGKDVWMAAEDLIAKRKLDKRRKLSQ